MGRTRSYPFFLCGDKMLELGGHLQFDKSEAMRVLPRAISALRKNPGDVKILGDIGHCYNVLEKEEIALEYFKKASVSANPYAWLNYAAILRQCGRHEEAKLYAWNAHKARPDDKKAGHIYAEELIRNGQWLKAWPLCAKYRISKDSIEITGLPEWKGEDISGQHLLIVCEGGRGDFFWLLRFIPKLTARGITVSLVAPEDIAVSFGTHPYLGNPNDAEHARPYDRWVSLFELLQWLNVEKPFWPGPYIQADPEKTALRNAVIRPSVFKKVGLCWDCGELVDVRKYRSLKKEQAARLLSCTMVDWISLQKDQSAPVPCLEPTIRTWSDTAAIIANLDLVITVDTAVAHLAGAMGKPTWLVLGGFQDCKWMTGETTGWYPSFRIFRNEGFGFENVLGKIETAINAIYQLKN
jgi:tetratricopeptide (TPR) repeat protein